jgi:hypothetical protein
MKTLARNLTQSILQWNLYLLALVAVALAICAPAAVAQSGAGSIQGTVTDSTGAVIPGALIHVVNVATNVAADAKSNGVGFYQVPELFTGTYNVTVTAPGMKTYKTSIELLVAQSADINPAMSTGAVTQQVEVAADAVQLTTTDNGTIASTLEASRINQLPMNGRNLLTLTADTTPGLEASGQRSNGLMAEAMDYVADGVSLNNRQFGGVSQTQSQLPDPDAVQEVRIETTNTSAQYSEPGTAILTTKSGTNSLHGAVFWTQRDNAIGNGKPREAPSVNYVLPSLVRKEFGASAGGPIILPKVYHGKDKSFWFFAWEEYSNKQTTPENVTVPTDAERGGNFSALTNGAGNTQVLYDPATTQASANCAATPLNPVNPYCRTQFDYNGTPNAINPTELAPTTKIIYDLTQHAGNQSLNPALIPNLASPNPNNIKIPNYTFRFDHEFNENNRAYLRMTSVIETQVTLRNYPINSPYTVAADGFPAEASGIAYNPTANYGAAFGYTHVFSPTFFAETIVSQQWYSQHNFAGGTPCADFEKQLLLPNNFGEGGFPNFGAQLICPYGGTQFIYGLSQIVQTIDENMSKTIGRQQFQFGGRFRHERFGDLPDESADTISFGSGTFPTASGANASGVYNPASGANYSALPNTGYPDADAFLGAPSSFSVTQEPPYSHYHDFEFDAYFQDNYRVNKALTLNLGLRWEAHPAAWTKYGLMNSFDLKNDAMVLAAPPATLISEGYTTQTIITNMENIGAKYETAQEAGLPATTLMRNYLLTFSPRVGLAYQLFGGKTGTVIRGAYGRYIYPMPTRSYLKNLQQNNPFVASYSQSYTAANQSPDGQPNYLIRANPLPVVMGSTGTTADQNVVNSASTNSLLPGVSLWNNSSSMPPDYVTQTNFTIEQALKGNSALRVTWLWSHGTNLDHYYYPNAHPSNFVWETAYGIVPPTGGASVIGTPQQNTYAATATGPYDQTTWGSNTWDVKNGWSNDNALQATYQRLFHHGIAYQISYVWSKPFRVGGNYFRDGTVYPEANFAGVLGAVSPYDTGGKAGGGTFLPPALPPVRPSGAPVWAEYHQLDRFEEYKVDTAIPKQHITFNGIVDLPFGQGKKFLGNANKALNELVGGWQLAGDGSIISQDFADNAGNWGPTSKVKYYKQHKITDCRSGVCLQENLWYNGFILPSAYTNCTTKCVTGLPTDYTPSQQPIQAAANTNNVEIALSNGTEAVQGYSPSSSGFGSNPYSLTILNGPINWTIDTSLFKVFPIRESMDMRFNFDAFNALNVQGYNNPNTTDGTENFTSSYNTPRQIQMTLRLEF